ncbi:MAG: hypothetical protein ABIH11_02065 [Candidatus Altiarchaeota archaeon]
MVTRGRTRGSRQDSVGRGPGDLELYDHAGRVVSRKRAGSDVWVSDDMLSSPFLDSRRVAVVGDAVDLRAKAEEVQRRLVRKDALNYLEFVSTIDNSSKIFKYIVERQDSVGGIPKEESDFCSRLGFDRHMYYYARDDLGESSLEEYARDRRGLLERHGLRDFKSYGRFLSMAFPGVRDVRVIRDTERAFFAYLAEPLLEAVSKAGSPDESLSNFKMITDQFPPKYRPGLFISLGRHPSAVERLAGIGWTDQDGLKDFFTRFLRNPEAFDGIVT